MACSASTCRRRSTHRGYGFDQVIGQLGFGTEGIYGTPTYVSSSYIFLFILFGSFLEQAGMIKLFTDFALGLFGHRQGGPAKVAVVSSGLMGTINGSGVANVVTTGQFTIPLMKRFGYSPAFAGGVEATSSMGGQIMPPVMGAVAFIMSETINVPYVEICKAALVPALLYFMTAFIMVHLEAGRAGLLGIPKDECPNPWRAVKDRWYLVLPLAMLVFLLFSGYTPLFSGMVSLALTVVLIFGFTLACALRRHRHAHPVLDRHRRCLLGLLRVRHRRGHGGDRRDGGRALRRGTGRTGHAEGRDRCDGQRRPPCTAGRRGMRAGRRDHRRADADGRGDQLRRLHHPDGRKEPVPEPRC